MPNLALRRRAIDSPLARFTHTARPPVDPPASPSASAPRIQSPPRSATPLPFPRTPPDHSARLPSTTTATPASHPTPATTRSPIPARAVESPARTPAPRYPRASLLARCATRFPVYADSPPAKSPHTAQSPQAPSPRRQTPCTWSQTSSPSGGSRQGGPLAFARRTPPDSHPSAAPRAGKRPSVLLAALRSSPAKTSAFPVLPRKANTPADRASDARGNSEECPARLRPPATRAPAVHSPPPDGIVSRALVRPARTFLEVFRSPPPRAARRVHPPLETNGLAAPRPASSRNNCCLPPNRPPRAVAPRHCSCPQTPQQTESNYLAKEVPVVPSGS